MTGSLGQKSAPHSLSTRTIFWSKASNSINASSCRASNSRSTSSREAVGMEVWRRAGVGGGPGIVRPRKQHRLVAIASLIAAANKRKDDAQFTQTA